MDHDDNLHLVNREAVGRHVGCLRAEGVSVVLFDMWSLGTEMMDGILFALELRQQPDGS
jgi:hypothetical protein